MDTKQNKASDVACPVCKAFNAKVIWSVDSETAARHYVLPEREQERYERLVSVIEKLWQNSVCHVKQCSECGFYFADPYVAGDSDFYGVAYQRSHYPTTKWEFEITSSKLKSLANSETRLLEIGAGDGAFVRKVLAETSIEKSNILCTEFSDYGRDSITKLGVDCRSIDIRALDGPEVDEGFDAICLFQVLEHLDRLDQLFKRLHAMARSGANVFLAVPNDDLIEFYENHNALLDMPPNHVGRWNRTCFSEVAKRNGFELVDYAKENAKFPHSHLKYLKYCHLRQSQFSGSLANRVESQEPGLIRTAGRACSLTSLLFRRLPSILRLRGSMGSSQWAHLRRT